MLLVARAFDEGDPAAARRLLACRWRGEGALARVDALALEALVARGDVIVDGPVHAANAAPPSLRWAALEVLDARTPLLRFGRVAASRAIVGACADAATIHAIEVGGGEAAPWTELVDQLALQRRPPLLRVAALNRGSERSAEVELRRARLAAFARRRGVVFEWAEIEARGGALAAFAEDVGAGGALAVHVDEVFERGGAAPSEVEIGSLRPRVVTSVEASIDGGERSLVGRVAGLRDHYRRVFEVLEGRVDGRTRSILERECYGRALLDRLVEEGPPTGPAGGAARGLGPVGIDGARGASELGGSPGVSPRAIGPAVALCWRGEPLLRASAWVDRRARR